MNADRKSIYAGWNNWLCQISTTTSKGYNFDLNLSQDWHCAANDSCVCS